jgi:hypothetical protein
MKKFLVIVGLFVCLSGWYSCTRDIAVAPNNGACDTTGITYNKHIYRIVNAYCTNLGGCHNPNTGLGSGFGLTALPLITLAEVQNGDQDTTSATSIVCWIKSGCSGVETMPKGARQLSRAYIDTFLMWKANNYCQGN